MKAFKCLDFLKSCTKTTLGKLGAGLLALTVLTASQSVAWGQINEGTTQPPEPAKPRFPQLPKDEPGKRTAEYPPRENPIVTEEEAPPRTIVGVDREEEVARLVEIAGRKLTIEDNKDKGNPYIVTVAPSAKVTLNRKPAKVEDLRPNDVVRITKSLENPDIAVEVAAARVIHDTPPQEPPRNLSPRRPATIEGRQVPNEQGGLGVVVSDSPGDGIVILDVHRNTPAWTSGIQTGDFLISVNQKKVLTPDDFLVMIRQQAPGEAVRLSLWRDGKNREGTVTLTTQEAARDRVALDDRPHIISETHGDDTVVIKRTPGKTEVLDREPEESTVIVDKEPREGAVVIEQNADRLPEDYEDLAEQYRLLQRRMAELERELDRLKKTE